VIERRGTNSARYARRKRALTQNTRHTDTQTQTQRERHTQTHTDTHTDTRAASRMSIRAQMKGLKIEEIGVAVA
jgi:hypothetical protein